MTRHVPNNWQELMAGYALNDLSPEEAEAIQSLLSENPDLTAEVASLQEVLALMPYAIPQQNPPAQLKDKILAAVAAPSAELPPVQTAPLQPVRYRRWSTRLGAIAAVALLALAADNLRLRQEAAQTQSVIAALEQRGTQTYSLLGTQEADAASGSLVVAQGQQVILVAKNLPVLPSGQVYRLWAMPPSGKNPTFCGQFNASTRGKVTTQWLAPEAACQSTTVQMLITSEKSDDPPVPKGALVMQSQI